MREDNIMMGGDPASAERLMRESMKVGGELRYPCRRKEAYSNGTVSAHRYIACHVTGIYPHLVTVMGSSWNRMPVRTISYAEMLTDRKITRWEVKR